MHVPPPKTLEALLATCTPEVCRLLERARKSVLAAVPSAVERYRAGWGLIGYNAPHYFAFLVPDATQIRMGFEWGVALSDPLQMLDGTGRQVRYVNLQSELLREAAAFRPPRRSRR